MERIVYSVDACWEYEGAYPVKLFSSESDAKEYADCLNEWKSREPELAMDSSEYEQIEWTAKYDKWALENPVVTTTADGFYVNSLTLVDENEC